MPKRRQVDGQHTLAGRDVNQLLSFFVFSEQGAGWQVSRECHLSVYRLRRPDHAEHAKMARWLIAENDWGTVSTTSIHLAGAAFGNLVSYADGPRGNSTGRLLFYLTPMDATATDLAVNSAATLTVGEVQLAGSCGVMDPEDPTCAKVSISGRMQIVPGSDVAEAEQLLFRRHPQMKMWPSGHNFSIWELHVQEARLLDFYGGAATVTPEDYFTAELQRRTAVIA